MAWRKWLVRGLVFSLLGLPAVAAVAYQAWTNPAAVRAEVIAHVRSHLVADAAAVSLDSARLRLFGGIAVSELRVTRADGLDRKSILYVPSGVIYHDKERLARGAFVVRKLELHRPQVRLVRQRDGRCNLSDLFAPRDPDEPVPTVVVDQGTVLLEDQAASPDAPLLEIKDVALTAVEDPPGVVTVAGTGRTDVAGPVRFGAVAHRDTGGLTATLDLSAVPVGPDLVQRLAAFDADCAAQVRQLRGDGKVHASVAYNPGASQPFTYDVSCTLANGAFSHARLPLPLERIDGFVHIVNGVIPFAHGAARSGDTRLELTLKDVVPPKTPPDDLYDPVGELDLQVDHLPITNELVQQLPPQVRKLNDDFRPGGVVHVTHTLRRTGPGTWRKRWLLKADGGAEAEFKPFPYKLNRIRGSIDFECTSEKTGTTDVDVTGFSGPHAITLKGKVHGSGPNPAVDLEVAGDDLPLDDKLFKALNEQGQKTALQFLPERSRQRGLRDEPMGRGDIRATIHREQDKDFVNRYLVRFHDASVKYDLFPVPLEKVNGELDLHIPGTWECRGFRGVHEGGVFHIDGRSYLPRDGGPERIYVLIQGDDVAVDTEDFKSALAPSDLPARLPLRHAWEELAVTGRMSFKAVVDQAPSRPKDIDVTVSTAGCSLRPRFFPYALQQVSGAVRYTHDNLYISDLKARHGATALSLNQGRVTLRPGGGSQVRFSGLHGAPLVADADFLEALPDPLRNGLRPLHLTGPLTTATDLVVDMPSEPAGPVVIWWDGSADLHDAALRLGVDVTGVEGTAACCGLYNGRRLETLVGNVLVRQAEVFGQPLQNLHARVEVAPGSPDTLRFRDLKADLYGGTVGGEGRVEFAEEPRYDVTLKALQIDLAQFARRNNFGPDAQMKGLASAGVHLSGEGTDVGGLKGDGRIDVPEGKLYRLPLQLDLLKAVGLRLPDRTAFEQAHAAFSIEGPQLQVQNLDLYGNAVSLRGKGTVDLTGDNLNLDFNADWGRMAQLLPPGVNDIPRTLSDQLLRIKMRGRIGDVRIEKELAPLVVDPILRALGP